MNEEQLNKLFQLAGINIPEELNDKTIAQALVEIEKKLITSTYHKSELNLDYIPTILVVDDLELSIHQLSLLLTKSGFNVHIARSLDEAIQQFKKHTYNYMLVDLFLPEPEDGLSLIANVATSKKAEKDGTKIIVISGTDNKSLVNQCFEKGANEFIEKSPDWHERILKYIRKLEYQKAECKDDICTIIEDEDKKIVTITISNINKPKIIQGLEREITTQIHSGYINIIIDMKNITNIDSSAVGALICGYKTCSENKGKLVLCNVSQDVRDTLTYVFLHNIILIYKDNEAALKSFNA